MSNNPEPGWNEFRCPICKAIRPRKSWYDDNVKMTVEIQDECKPCEYLNSYCYGQFVMTVGAREFGFYQSYSGGAERRQRKLFKRAVRHARRVYVRLNHPNGY